MSAWVGLDRLLVESPTPMSLLRRDGDAVLCRDGLALGAGRLRSNQDRFDQEVLIVLKGVSLTQQCIRLRNVASHHRSDVALIAIHARLEIREANHPLLHDTHGEVNSSSRIAHFSS